MHVLIEDILDGRPLKKGMVVRCGWLDNIGLAGVILSFNISAELGMLGLTCVMFYLSVNVE